MKTSKEMLVTLEEEMDKWGKAKQKHDLIMQGVLAGIQGQGKSQNLRETETNSTQLALGSLHSRISEIAKVVEILKDSMKSKCECEGRLESSVSQLQSQMNELAQRQEDAISMIRQIRKELNGIRWNEEGEKEEFECRYCPGTSFTVKEKEMHRVDPEHIRRKEICLRQEEKRTKRVHFSSEVSVADEQIIETIDIGEDDNEAPPKTRNVQVPAVQESVLVNAKVSCEEVSDVLSEEEQNSRKRKLNKIRKSNNDSFLSENNANVRSVTKSKRRKIATNNNDTDSNSSSNLSSDALKDSCKLSLGKSGHATNTQIIQHERADRHKSQQQVRSGGKTDSKNEADLASSDEMPQSSSATISQCPKRKNDRKNSRNGHNSRSRKETNSGESRQSSNYKDLDVKKDHKINRCNATKKKQKRTQSSSEENESENEEGSSIEEVEKESSIRQDSDIREEAYPTSTYFDQIRNCLSKLHPFGKRGYCTEVQEFNKERYQALQSILKLFKLAIRNGENICQGVYGEDTATFLHCLLPRNGSFLTPTVFDDIVKSLIDLRCYQIVHMLGPCGETILQKAVRTMKVKTETLSLLHLNGVNFNTTSKVGNPLIFDAIRGPCSTTMLSNLIDLGANWRVVHESTKDNALHIAARFCGNPEILKYLLNLGEVPVNDVNRAGDTPLHLCVRAVEYGNRIEKTKLLLKKGANVEAMDKAKRTPLQLLESGENPDKRLVNLLRKYKKKITPVRGYV